MRVETEEKFVTRNWVHVPPGLVSGGGGKCGRPLKLNTPFWEIVVGRFKCGKWVLL